jgi:hypothetical protein
MLSAYETGVYMINDPAEQLAELAAGRVRKLKFEL